MPSCVLLMSELRNIVRSAVSVDVCARLPCDLGSLTDARHKAARPELSTSFYQLQGRGEVAIRWAHAAARRGCEQVHPNERE